MVVGTLRVPSLVTAHGVCLLLFSTGLSTAGLFSYNGFLPTGSEPNLSPGVSQGAFLLTGPIMPKMKTHKGSRKRFRVTASGKLKRAQAGKKHLNSPKSAKRKMHLRAKVVETDRLSQKYLKVMGEVK